MSADNWATCPACNERRNEKVRKLEEKKQDAYGKVSEPEYLLLMRAEVEPIDASLREDYELGVDESGCFYVLYGGRCDCGFSYSFKAERHLVPEGPLSVEENGFDEQGRSWCRDNRVAK